MAVTTTTPATAALPSTWASVSHPGIDEVNSQVDGSLLQHWPFPNEKVKKKFVAAGFSSVKCRYFPLACNDHTASACKLLTIVFLSDGKLGRNAYPASLIIGLRDILEDRSFEEGRLYHEHLMPIAKDEVKPNSM